MSRKQSRKPKPKPSPTVTIASKKQAAIGQLESAIFLWFNDADPISILVLAWNAHECYHALGKRLGKPSFIAQGFEALPPSMIERARYIQDFAKHGEKDIDEESPFETKAAEAYMIASVVCHEQIYVKVTPLMALYSTRFFFENPNFAVPGPKREHFVYGSAVYQLGSGSRKEFLDQFYDGAVEMHG